MLQKSVLLATVCMWLAMTVLYLPAYGGNEDVLSDNLTDNNETSIVGESQTNDQHATDREIGGTKDNGDNIEQDNDDAEEDNGEDIDDKDDDEVGEASYNVQDCEALNEKLDEKNSDGGVIQKDLDECEKIVK